MLLMPTLHGSEFIHVAFEDVWHRWFSPQLSSNFPPASLADTDTVWLSGPFEDWDKANLPQYVTCTPSGEGGAGHAAWGDMYAIVLDYDDGVMTTDSFKSKFGHLHYYLYTTSSHTPQHHRFKVLVWLLQPIPYREIHADKHIILDYFGVDDGSSLSNRHKPPNWTPHYFCDHNQGKHWYSLDMIEAHRAHAPNKRRAFGYGLTPLDIFTAKPKTVNNPAGFKTACTRELLEMRDKIPQFPTGGRRRGPCYRLVATMADTVINGYYAYTDREIAELMLTHIQDDKRYQLVMDITTQRRNQK